MNRVAITGIGIMSPIGCDPKTVTASLLEGVSGIGRIEGLDTAGLGTDIGAEVRDFDPSAYFDRRDARRMDRFSQLSMAAAVSAYGDSGLNEGTYEPGMCGSYIGSGIGGMKTLEEEHKKLLEKGPDRVSPLFIPMLIGNMAAGNVSNHFRITGPSMCIVTACASGANSIGEAMRAIRHGYIDMAFAGGAEAPLTRAAISGFWNMNALSTAKDPSSASMPFDKRRSGFVIGEGSAVLVLERYGKALERGARIYAELAGYGCTDDAYHITSPDPEGKGASRAMSLAIRDAGLTAGDIGYINAHGTSTPLNDRYETLAIKKTFGDTAYDVPVSSTKSMTGHLLGAAGALEAAFSALALYEGFIPPTTNYSEPDPDCDLDYVPNRARKADLAAVISNSLGFGGHNACLALTKASVKAGSHKEREGR